MTQAHTHDSNGLSQNWLSLVVFRIVVIGGGSLIGTITAPGAWYAGLDKPPFNPPNWIFAPVWTALYIAIAIAGWRLWKLDRQSLPMKLWFAQLAVNWLWSPVFFRLEMLWVAFFVLSVMWLLILGVIVTAWRKDNAASVLMLPYLGWVSFAGLLNASVAWLN